MNKSIANDLFQTVDICITTTYKELEHVCLLAEVLARRMCPLPPPFPPI